jgi:hypothetical protein
VAKTTVALGFSAIIWRPGWRVQLCHRENIGVAGIGCQPRSWRSLASGVAAIWLKGINGDVKSLSTINI